MRDYVPMPTRRLRTANYSDEARRRLGDAVAKAREAAGYKHVTKFARAAGIESVASVRMLESGKPGVAQSILFAVGRFLPGWTEDTPRAILEGADAPPVEAQTIEVAPDAASAEEPSGDDLLRVDHQTLRDIVLDPDKLGTDDWFRALGILLADEEINEEAFKHAVRVGRRIRRARQQAAKDLPDFQQSLAERAQ